MDEKPKEKAAIGEKPTMVWMMTLSCMQPHYMARVTQITHGPGGGGMSGGAYFGMGFATGFASGQ